MTKDRAGYPAHIVMETSTKHNGRFDGAVKLVKTAQAFISSRALVKIAVLRMTMQTGG